MAYYFKGERTTTTGDVPTERGRSAQRHNHDNTHPTTTPTTAKSTRSRSRSKSPSPSKDREGLLDHLQTLKKDLENGPQIGPSQSDLRNDPFSLFSNAAVSGPAATAGPFDLTRYQHQKHPTSATTNTTRGGNGVGGVHINKASHQGDQRKKGSAGMIVLQWDTPAEIPYGTLLDHHQLNAWTEPLVPGEFVYYLVGDGISDVMEEEDGGRGEGEGEGGGDILLARQVVSKDLDPPLRPHAKGANPF